jgi:phage-related protein
MDERLSKGEIRKDAVQNTVEAAAGTVGQVASIITTAVKDVAQTVGGFATELFEIRDQARRAAADQESPAVSPAAAGLHADPDAIEPTAADVHPDPDAPTP